MSKKPPEILYKYRCFDARSISMLANNQIYFASPLDFNDPFDCRAHEYTFGNFSAEGLKLMASLHPKVSPEAINRENTARLIEALKEHPKIKQIGAEQQNELNQFNKDIGVLALSACNDSILMWSHYANYHKGFCIGFKNNLGLDENCVMEVSYTKNRNNDLVLQYLASQTMSPEDNHKRLIKEFICTKYSDWEYEQEWRIMGSKGIAIYPPSCVDRIIFGLNMPPEERNTIRYLFLGTDVKFFQAVKSTRDFEVKIQEVDSTIKLRNEKVC